MRERKAQAQLSTRDGLDGTRIMPVRDAAGPPEELEFLLTGRSLRMLSSISSNADVFGVGDIGNEIVSTHEDMMFTMRKLPGE